ncbi:cisplatin damage response ATP-dependent DNA ligase [Legionella sp. km772]|uniref:cisplatin damage response ATP-dependent DNA ligase n=1 Tax=Legionella sp. km772 TaxID=2498111 RepID=UPI000F8D5028|nr:cisplatin damage response ATP-dependent DNA ligase [Legionella sp. km772]RUR05257.1 cisplatin damage response ATP-dependent DNA ligase [Legionella sp. km772]
MKYFAQLLNTLFFTYGHLDKMTVIQEYLARTPDPERGYALAIMADSLSFPTFKRSLIKELIQEKIDPVLFELSYDYVGDLSETLALLWPETQTVKQELPSLAELIIQFNHLDKNEIRPYLEYLLNQSNATERWALLKLGLGSLRIGISARFLKNTLAKYGGVDVQEIEHLWHGLRPPYIELFSWLEKGSAKPSLEDAIFFHPVMLSHPLNEEEVDSLITSQFNYEKKFDGIRVQVISTPQGKALFTRTGDEISASFPEVLDSIHSNVVLDGELVIIKDGEIGSFNQLQQRLNRKSLTKKLLLELPAGLIAYDILFLEGQDLRQKKLTARRDLLENWFTHNRAPNIVLSDLLLLREAQTLQQLKQQLLAENHPAVEGLMIKHKESVYIAGRPKGLWYKWKREPLTVDAVLMYAQRGHGKRSSYYSDYTFGLWSKDKIVTIGKAYFGFTDAELIELDKWIRTHTIQRFGSVREVKKELVFEVSFDAVNYSSRHKSGVALRFPRINRIRWDKPVAEIDHLETLIQLIKN